MSKQLLQIYKNPTSLVSIKEFKGSGRRGRQSKTGTMDMILHTEFASTHCLKLAWILLIISTGNLNAVEADDSVSYSRDIRPILSGKCFYCHGPDEEVREADLRLDSFEAATQGDMESAAIVPGKSSHSELVRRILSDDPDEQMPPPASNKSLTQEQKLLLQSWIDSGAKYEQHWSFIRPTLPAIPQVADADWGSNEIDRFILARLEAESLKPSQATDARTLIRRVHLDLVGLPPDPEEADKWAARLTDSDGRLNVATYAVLVDHLLELPQYGERWARRWLDLARYADTNGYEKDRNRTMWPYRDWVVRALNADMPFDQFTIEQVAGDMLPAATVDQRIATGFHRNTMLNEEGGIDPLEFRFYAMTDRVATTGTTWLGLTTGCCQCHTHKYDPITHREYFGLMAFLNNTDEPDLNLPVPAAEQRYARNLGEAEKQLARLSELWPVEDSQDIKMRDANLEAAFADWLAKERQLAVAWQFMHPSDLKSNLPHLTVQPDGSVFASGDTTKFDTYELTFRDVPTGATAIRLEALPDERLPAHGPGSTYYEGRKGDFFLNEFVMSLDGQPVDIKSASHSYAKNQFGTNPVSASLTIDGDLQTGWSAASRPGERSVAVYLLSEPLATGKSLKLKMTFGRHFASSLGRFRLSAVNADGDIAAREWSTDIETLMQTSDGNLTPEDRRLLKDEFLLHAPQLAEQAAKIKNLRRRPKSLEVPVLAERPTANPRPTHLHNRGEYLQPGNLIEAGVPAALHQFPDNRPKNRLEFARWLVSPDNPLTARVVANRHWAAFFGTGIVKTVDDFGMQGEAPSHPELLDWLAVSLVENGWSIKSLHRKIALSSTYRQTSTFPEKSTSPNVVGKSDISATRLLARFPRTRLEAEIIRDVVLKSAGLLSLKQGGPPVRPPQTDGISETSFGRPKWNASTGEDRHRRSIYIYQKRTAPFAMLTTFDAPSGESCVARRDVSNTALQALTLLNDEMFLEAARALGGKLATIKKDDASRIALAFQRVMTRQPSVTETARLSTFVDIQRARIRIEHEAARLDEFKAALKKAAAEESARQKAAEKAAREAVQKAAAEKKASTKQTTRDKTVKNGADQPPTSLPKNKSEVVSDKKADEPAVGKLNPLPTEPMPVDENAVELDVWTNVARALFSLDETLTKN